MSGSNESFIQLPPDGPGKAVDAFQVTTPRGQLLYRQGVVIADNSIDGNSTDVDEQSRLQVRARDNGLLDLIAEDVASADGTGPGLLKPPGMVADGTEPSLVVQLSPLSQLQLDQTVPAVIGGIGPDGAARRARVGIDGGLQQSDGVSQTFTAAAVGNLCVVDTSGYGSVSLQLSGTWVGNVIFYCSNDGETWFNFNGFEANASLAPGGSSGSNNLFIFQPMGRYFRAAVSAYTSGLIVGITCLRSAPMNALVANNLTQIGNAAISQSGGVQGFNLQQIGAYGIPGLNSGNVQSIIPVGTSDPAGTARVMRADITGLTQISGVLPAGYQLGAYNFSYTTYTTQQNYKTLTAAQSIPAPVLVGALDQTKAAQFLQADNFGFLQVASAPSTPAAQSIQDLLTQLLAISRVSAQYLYEIRAATAGAMSPFDEPDVLLADFLSPATALSNMTN